MGMFILIYYIYIINFNNWITIVLIYSDLCSYFFQDKFKTTMKTKHHSPSKQQPTLNRHAQFPQTKATALFLHAVLIVTAVPRFSFYLDINQILIALQNLTQGLKQQRNKQFKASKQLAQHFEIVKSIRKGEQMIFVQKFR